MWFLAELIPTANTLKLQKIGLKFRNRPFLMESLVKGERHIYNLKRNQNILGWNHATRFSNLQPAMVFDHSCV